MRFKHHTYLVTLTLLFLSCIFISSCSNSDELLSNEDIQIPGLYEIDSVELGGWDKGFILCDENITKESVYVLTKQLGEEKVLYLNYLKGDTINGITIYIKPNNDIGENFFKDDIYSVENNDNSLT